MRRAMLSAARIPLSRNRLVPAVIVARREVERGGVDAVAQAGRVRAVRKEVAQMSAAMAAGDFGAPHTQRVVFLCRDVALRDDVVEAGPASPRLELRARIEKRFVADDAAIGPLAVVVPVRPGERRLRTRLLGHRGLDRAELGATLVDFWIARHFASPRFGSDADCQCARYPLVRGGVVQSPRIGAAEKTAVKSGGAVGGGGRLAAGRQ